MTADQMVGYTLRQTTAVTAITSTRVYHGMRPEGTDVPCINFFSMPGGGRKDGMDSQYYSINCRAVTSTTARNLANIVIDAFHGPDGRGMKGDVSGFSIISSSLQIGGGLIFEPDGETYNSPVDIKVIYPTSTVT